MSGPDFINRAEDVDKYVIEELGDPRIPNNESLEDMWILFDEDNYNYNVQALKETADPYKTEAQIPEPDDFTIDAMDQFLNNKKQMAYNYTMQHGMVKSRKKGRLWKPCRHVLFKSFSGYKTA